MVRPYVHLRSPYERIKLLSGIYPFNSLPLQIIKYNFVEQPADAGYIPLTGRIELPLIPPRDRPWTANGIDSVKIEALRSLVERCEAEGIQLYPVLSPCFEGLLFGEEMVAEIRKVLEDSPYTLWDLSGHEDYIGHTDLFRDRDHLNREGAESYTRLLVERILGS